MKKIILAFWAFALMSNTVLAATTFSDVNSSTHYFKAIQWMAENGVIKGYGDGSFGPDQCVNRAEFLKMLFRTSEVDVGLYSATLFSDTPENQWYSQYVIAAKARGSIQGYSDGTFKPGQCVNRVEALKVALEEFDMMDSYEGYEMKFLPNDVWLADDNVWWRKYFMRGDNANFVPTDHFVKWESTDGPTHLTYNYGPGEAMTRKEVAELLYRMKAAKDQGSQYYADTMTPLGLLPTDDCVELGADWDGARWKGNSPLAFCYKTVWGEPELDETAISPEARIGTIYYVTFTKSISNSPLLSYETLDFKKTGDSDVPAVINWSMVDFSKSNADLAKLIVGDKNVVAEKLVINGKNVLKVESDRPQWDSEEVESIVQYFVPKVTFNGVEYNLHLVGDAEIEADLDKVIASISW